MFGNAPNTAEMAQGTPPHNALPAPHQHAMHPFHGGWGTFYHPNGGFPSLVNISQHNAQTFMNNQDQHMQPYDNGQNPMINGIPTVRDEYGVFIPLVDALSYHMRNGQFANSSMPGDAPFLGLNAAAAPFIPATQSNVISQRQACPHDNMPFQSQGGMMQTPQMAPMGMMQDTQGMMPIPPVAQMGMMQATHGTMTSPPMAQMGMQQSFQPKQKRTTKRGRPAKPDNTASKSRNKPANNSAAVARMPGMGKMVNRLDDIAHGGTLPPDVTKDVDMTPRPQPKHSAVEFLNNPEQYPTVPHTSPMGSTTSEDSTIEQLLQHHLTQYLLTPPQSSPTVQTAALPTLQPTAQPVHQPAPQPAPPLTKNEKYLRQAARDGIIPHPSKRRVVRIERNDPRLEHDEKGEPITPPSDSYSIYYVPTSHQHENEDVDRDLIDRMVRELQDNKAADKQQANNNKTVTDNMPTGQVNVSKRRKPTKADTFDATDACTVPGVPSDMAEFSLNEFDDYLNSGDGFFGPDDDFDIALPAAAAPSNMVEFSLEELNDYLNSSDNLFESDNEPFPEDIPFNWDEMFPGMSSTDTTITTIATAPAVDTETTGAQKRKASEDDIVAANKKTRTE